MAIHYECRCGANIRLRDSAAGRRARCQSCGATFTVPPVGSEPADAPIPLEDGGHGQAAGPDRPTQKPYAWLEEFSKAEAEARSESTRTPLPVVTAPAGPIELSEPTPSSPAPAAGYGPADDGRDWIVAPTNPFWLDLLGSFVFFLDPSNLVTFLVLVFLPILLSFVPFVGCAFNFVISFYIMAFYMEVVRGTASGSDELPEVVWITSWTDLLEPLGQFVGTVLWVLLPAAGLAGYTWHESGRVAWEPVTIVAAAGLAFWPIVVLQVAIGGKVSGLWPHTTVLTALSAPLGYLAVCLVVLFAAGIHALPFWTPFQQTVAQTVPPNLYVALHVAQSLIGMYTTIVAMRAIGLFYRHFKHRFPWVAE